jgi:hypothetical protein
MRAFLKNILKKSKLEIACMLRVAIYLDKSAETVEYSVSISGFRHSPEHTGESSGPLTPGEEQQGAET